MLTLKSLQVRGFRDFLDSRDFPFNSPITLLFGQNRCGKSSTLNAIEWGLFGSDCSGKQTNIRERVDWVVINRHANPGEVTVELELDSPDGVYLVRRNLRTRARRKGADGDVEVELPDGECLTGAQAAQFLDRLLRCTFRDFATTVYQHQEAIRAIVTQEPRDRNDAIDRLLGLSDHRNLLNALNKVNAKGWQKDFLVEYKAFENEVETALKTREHDLEERRHEAGEASVPRNKLNAKAALAMAGDVQRALEQFTTETGLDLPPLQVPQEWTGLKSFCKAARAAISNLRGEIPAAREQEELVEKRGKIIGLQSDLNSAKAQEADIGTGMRELDKEYGTQNAVEKQLAKVRQDIAEEKTRLREINSRAVLIREAISFLETEGEKDRSSNLCPICGNEAPALLDTLRRQWEEKLQTQAQTSDKKIKSLQTKEKALHGAAHAYETWNGKLEAVVNDLVRYRQQSGELLDKELQADDDPVALLNAEADRIKRRLKKLTEAVKEKQDRLDQIEQELEKVRIINDILHLQEKKKILEQIQQSPEHTAQEGVRDRAAEGVRQDLPEVLGPRLSHGRLPARRGARCAGR